MSQFAPLIREYGEQLCVPQPARSRILLEISADLEDLYAHYQGQGLSPEAAATRTRETLALSGEAIERLVRIHEPPFRRLLDLLSVQAQTAWERITLLVVALCVVVLTVREVLTTRSLVSTSHFVWPLAAIAVLAMLIALVKIYSLYLKQDHDLRRLRRGLDALLFLAITSLGLGLLGLLVELYLTAIRVGSAGAQPYLPELLIRSSTLMIASMLVAVAVAVVWFVLLSTVHRIERAEAEVLMGPAESRGSGADMPPASGEVPRQSIDPEYNVNERITRGGVSCNVSF